MFGIMITGEQRAREQVCHIS